MFKLFFKNCYLKMDDFNCCLSKNDIIGNDILTSEDYSRCYKVCAKLGLKNVNSYDIICYCNNIIYVDFEKKRVIFNLGVYLKW